MSSARLYYVEQETNRLSVHISHLVDKQVNQQTKRDVKAGMVYGIARFCSSYITMSADFVIETDLSMSIKGMQRKKKAAAETIKHWYKFRSYRFDLIASAQLKSRIFSTLKIRYEF